MNPGVPLKECLCCEKVLLPGECTPRSFLRAAELVLLDYVGTTSPFDIKSLFAFPKVIGKIGDQEERGFNAEYKVYEEIKKSNLPIYIFYSLKPTNKNEELGDFLLVTMSSVIVLEVKAFELYTNPSEQDYEIIQKILSKQKNKSKAQDSLKLKITQKERVTEEIETFLEKHDCKPLTIHYFTVFANSNRPEDTTGYDSALFQDNYLKKIIGLSTPNTENRSAIESSQYSLRTLLAWLVFIISLRPRPTKGFHAEYENRELGGKFILFDVMHYKFPFFLAFRDNIELYENLIISDFVSYITGF